MLSLYKKIENNLTRFKKTRHLFCLHEGTQTYIDKNH